eukprot:TRINITY_DN29670_c0_g1_i1.p1 TRINITY_DN29670_c0_g1~~TRINITY_DN29670_c0_g1_i1.p1  ORF type:complete len:693 (-),score=206.81 TRINITY_DN29670_c0_g1_i1:76-2154(-)
MFFFFFQAEDGIRDAQESRGLGDVYKRQQQEARIEAMVLQCSQDSKHVTDLSQIADQLEASNIELTTANEAYQIKLRQLTAETLELRGFELDAGTAQAEAERFKLELEEASVAHRDCQHELKRMRTQHADAVAEVERLKIEISRLIPERSEFESEVERLSGELKAAKLRGFEKEAELDRANGTIKKLRGKAQGCEEESQRLTAEVTKLKARTSDFETQQEMDRQEVRRLSGRLLESKSLLEAANAEMARVRATHVGNDKESEKLRTEAARIKLECANLSEDKLRISSELKAAVTELENLKMELSKVVSEHDTRATEDYTQLQSLKRQLDSAQQEISRTSQKVTAGLEYARQLQEAQGHLELQLQQVCHDSADSAAPAQLTSTVGRLSTELEAIMQRHAQSAAGSDGVIQQLSRDLKQSRANETALQSNLDQIHPHYSSKIAGLNTAAHELQVEVTRVRGQLTAIEAALQDSRKAERHALDRAETATGELSQQRQDYARMHSTLSADLATLRDQIESHSTVVDSSSAWEEYYVREKAAWQQELSGYAARLQASEQESQAARAALTNERQQFMTTLQGMEAELIRLQPLYQEPLPPRGFGGWAGNSYMMPTAAQSSNSNIRNSVPSFVSPIMPPPPQQQSLHRSAMDSPAQLTGSRAPRPSQNNGPADGNLAELRAMIQKQREREGAETEHAGR